MGRLLNLFSRGFSSIDESLPSALLQLLSMGVATAMTFIVIGAVLPPFLFLALPLVALYRQVQRLYIPTNRQLKRLEAVARSPLLSLLTAIVDGTETIRAFRQEHRFLLQSRNTLHQHQKVYYLSIAINRWLAVRLETVGSLVVFFSALLAAVARGVITPGAGALAVAYALSITQQLNWLIRTASEADANAVSVERVVDYLHLIPREQLEPSPTLADTALAGLRREPGVAAVHATEWWRELLPPDWPSQGSITIKGLNVRYRSDTPLVLKDINLVIKPHEKYCA